jgi:NitT/TauT family transport system permease protein
LTQPATRLIERSQLVVAVRLALGVAPVVAVTAAIVINPQGPGYSQMRSQEQFRPDLLYAMILAIGFMGWGLNTLMVRLELRLSPPAAHAR